MCVIVVVTKEVSWEVDGWDEWPWQIMCCYSLQKTNTFCFKLLLLWKSPTHVWKIPISSVEMFFICGGIFQLLSCLARPWKWMFSARLCEVFILLCSAVLHGHRAVSLQFLSLLSLQHFLPSETLKVFQETHSWLVQGWAYLVSYFDRSHWNSNIKLFICWL